MFDEKYYTQLPGGILENFGRLFKNDLKIYVYPLRRSPTDELQTTATVNLKSDLQLLYDYLCRRGSFVQLDNYNPEYLSIFSRDVLSVSPAGTKPGTKRFHRKLPNSSATAASSDTRNTNDVVASVSAAIRFGVRAARPPKDGFAVANLLCSAARPKTSSVEAAACSRTLSECLPRRSFSEGWVSRDPKSQFFALLF